MNPDFSKLPPPPKGQTGITLDQFQHLPPPPQGQQGLTLDQIPTPQETYGANIPATGKETPLEALGKATANVPSSALNLGKNILIAAVHPIDTITGVFSALKGIGEATGRKIAEATGLPQAKNAPSQSEQTFNSILDTIKSRYGSLEEAQKTAINDPFGVGADIVGLVSGGASFAGKTATAAKVGETIAKPITAPMSAIKETVSPIIKENIVTPAKTAFTEAIKPTRTAFENRAILNAEQTWKAPTSEPSGFSGAKKILAKDPNTPKFLAEQGISPNTHLEDGKFNTTETAQSLRDTAGKMSSDALRPALKLADSGVEVTKVQSVTPNAVQYAKNTYNITSGNLETITKNINKEIAALNRKYPNGMKLSDLNDEQINYAKNGGFSPINDPSVNNMAIANRAIADSLGKTLVEKAPKDIPVQDLKTYLANYYKGADYLDALNGKKAPVSLAKSIARGVAKFGGAAVGAKMGGGVVSEFAGYQVGKAIEHALENMSAPLRDSYLRNLKVENPEAYKSVVNYIGQQQAEQATRLALPAGKTIFANPPAPKNVNSISVVSAKKNPVSVNPKTGKFQTSYSSTPNFSPEVTRILNMQGKLPK